MHLTLRRFIFYTLVLAFVVVGIYTLLVAFGFTFDNDGVRFVRTGSFFVSAVPRDAQLAIDGTPTEERPGLITGGFLVKNLSPRTHTVRFVREGRISWEASLPVTPGLVTRATGIFLWPVEATSTPVDTRVASFSLSAGVPVTAEADGTLRLGVRTVQGAEVAYASNDSGLLITKNDDAFYLVEPGAAGRVTNLTALFYSLKERDLGLPGAVPILTVEPHPFSSGKFIVITRSSLYLLDIRSVTLERLATTEGIAAYTVGSGEVLLVGKDGNLTVVDLIFKNSETAPFASSSVRTVALADDGAAIVTLDDRKTLTASYRATRETTTIGTDVSEFSVAPDGVRLAFVSGNAVKVYFLDEYRGDATVPRGTLLSIRESRAAADKLAWDSSLSRYLFFRSGETLNAAEVGLNGERGNWILARNVADFALEGYAAYVLKTDGTLVKFSFEK